MGLILFHPELAYRDCQHCLKYLYEEETGKLREFGGEPVERIKPAPCRTGDCPKGTPENPKTLSDKNLQAYQHWKECKAVGQFPDDAIVRKNASMIQELVDQAKEHRQMQMMSIMLLGKGGGS